MKSEIRNPKSEARNKFKIRISQCSKPFAHLNFGHSDLPALLSDFESLLVRWITIRAEK
jgi:hypothetical protein